MKTVAKSENSNQNVRLLVEVSVWTTFFVLLYMIHMHTEFDLSVSIWSEGLDCLNLPVGAQLS